MVRYLFYTIGELTYQSPLVYMYIYIYIYSALLVKINTIYKMHAKCIKMAKILFCKSYV